MLPDGLDPNAPPASEAPTEPIPVATDADTDVPPSPDGQPAPDTADGEGVGTEASTDGATGETEEARVVEARYKDTELLGRSFRVRRTIQEGGTQAIKGWQLAKAKMKNFFDKPGKAIKQYAVNRAQNSLNHKEARLNAAKSVRLRERHQAVVDKHRERLDQRTVSLKTHTDRMDKRIADVGKNERQRRQDYINELKDKKGNALARKAVRKQLRSEGATRRETRSIVAEIPAKHLDRIGQVAIVSEASRRMFEKAKTAEHGARARYEGTGRRISGLDESIAQYDSGARDADANITKITNELRPGALRHEAELAQRLAEMGDDDADRQRVEEEYQQAHDAVRTYNESLAHWRNVAAENRLQREAATREREGLRHARDTQLVNLDSARANADARGVVHHLDLETVNKEVTAVLNSDEKKEDS